MTNAKEQPSQAVIESIIKIGKLAKETADTTKANYDRWRSNTKNEMEETDAKVWQGDHGIITLVAPGTKEVLDWKALLSQLTPDQRAMVVVETPDLGKLEAAIELGLIDASMVAECITAKEGRVGHIRFEPNAYQDDDDIDTTTGEH